MKVSEKKGILAALLALSLAGCPESPVSTSHDGGKEGLLFDVHFCVPQCDGKLCGQDDGCGDACTVGFCTLGQRCEEGVCVCDGTSCPEGCCLAGDCYLGSADTHCGEAGATCVDCLQIDQSCGAEQTCIACTPQCAGKDCGAPNGCGGICSAGACPSGQTCAGGQCVCSAASCPTGCCRDNLCYPGNVASHCGRGGSLCADCRPSSQTCLSTRVCGCIPDCSNKACGAADGCGGVCQSGSCANGQVCVSGVCDCNAQSCPTGCCDSGENCQTGTADLFCGDNGGNCASCSAIGLQCVDRGCRSCDQWRVGPLAANMIDSAVDSDGRIYAVGATSTQLHLAKIDSCGQLELERSTIGSWLSLSGRSIKIVGNDLWAAGSLVHATDPGQGYYGRYSKATLTQSAGYGLSGGVDKDEVWSMVYTGSAFFMSGTASTDVPASTRAWSVKAFTTGQACGSRTMNMVGGRGGGAHVDASRSYVYYTGEQGAEAFVARYAADDCSCDLPYVACPAPWTMTFQIDGLTTVGRALVTVGTNLYVAGFYRTATDDVQGFVARIDLGTQSVTKTFKWAPSTKVDTLQGIAADGTRLYVVGGDQMETNLTGGRAIVMAFDFDLNRAWTRAPGDPRIYWDVEPVGSDGLIITGGDENEGYIRRCLRDGSC